MAVRISGINLPDNKHIEIALTALFGIGRSQSTAILAALKIDPSTKTRDLTSTEETSLRDYVEDKLTVEG